MDACGLSAPQADRDASGTIAKPRVFICDRAVNCGVIRHLLKERGWVENPDRSSRVFELKWTQRCHQTKLTASSSRRKQLVNHFRGGYLLHRKPNIARNLSSCVSCSKKIFPRQYNLFHPEQVSRFCKDFQSSAARAASIECRKTSATEESETERREVVVDAVCKAQALEGTRTQHASLDGTANAWILKPGNLSRGRGILVSADLQRLLKEAGSSSFGKRPWNYVVQKYIECPLTLRNHKVDLRLWVLVTSWSPLKIFVHRAPYFRVASKPYSVQSDGVFAKEAHVTNRTVHQNENRILLQEFLQRLSIESNYAGDDLDAERIWHAKTWPHLVDGVRAVLMSSQSMVVSSAKTFASRIRAGLDSQQQAFELYGLDFALDNLMKPWLLEVNCSPCMLFEKENDSLRRWGRDALSGLLDVVLAASEDALTFEASDSVASSSVDRPFAHPESQDETHRHERGKCYGQRLADVPPHLISGMHVKGVPDWLLVLDEVRPSQAKEAKMPLRVGRFMARLVGHLSQKPTRKRPLPTELCELARLSDCAEECLRSVRLAQEVGRSAAVPRRRLGQSRRVTIRRRNVNAHCKGN
jgi:tubulin monoglycylase TTLL3/8